MARQIINIGTTPNDGTGDTVRNAFDKVNDNFEELYDNPGGGVASVTGDSVDNSDPANPAVNAIPRAGTTPGKPITGRLEHTGNGSATYLDDNDSGVSIDNERLTVGLFDGFIFLTRERITVDGVQIIQERYKYGDGQIVFRYPAVMSAGESYVVNWQKKNGTVAYLSDIPSVTTPGLQAVTNVGATTDKTVGVKSVVIDMVYELKRGTGGFELWNNSIPSAPELMAIFPAGTSQNIAYQSWVANAISAAIQSASASVAGIMRLYTSTGSNTDGTMTQAAITNALNKRIGIIASNTTTSATVSGTTANTVTISTMAPAGTFAAGDNIVIKARSVKTGTNGTMTQRIYVNTVDSLTGATLLGTQQGSAANLLHGMIRTGCIKSATETEFVSPTASTSGDEVAVLSGGSVTNINIDHTVDQYYIVALQLANAGDSAVTSFIKAFKE